MRMSAYDAPSRFAVARATSASALLAASTSAAAAASRSRIQGARPTVPSAVDATFRNSRLIIRVRLIIYTDLLENCRLRTYKGDLVAYPGLRVRLRISEGHVRWWNREPRKLLKLRRGRRSRPVETRSVDCGVHLYPGPFSGRLPVRPGGDRLKGHLDSRDLAINREIVLCGNAANSGFGETHHPHQQAGRLVEVQAQRRLSEDRVL